MGQTAQEEEEEEDYFTISWTKLIAISGVFVLIGTIVMTIGYRMGSQSRMLDAHGREASAVVTGKSVTKRRGGSGTSTTNEYSVRYQFKVGNERHRDRKIVSRSFFDSVEADDTVPVRYLPSDPAINEIEPGQIRMNSRIAIGIGTLIVLLGGALLMMPRKVKKPARAIAETGSKEVSS